MMRSLPLIESLFREISKRTMSGLSLRLTAFSEGGVVHAIPVTGIPIVEGKGLANIWGLIRVETTGPFPSKTATLSLGSRLRATSAVKAACASSARSGCRSGFCEREVPHRILSPGLRVRVFGHAVGQQGPTKHIREMAIIL